MIPILADEAAEQLADAYPGQLEAAMTAAMLAPLQRMANLLLDDRGPLAGVFARDIPNPEPLAYGAMWAGVKPASEAQLRSLDYQQARWRRGSRPAVEAAIRSVLTGSKNARIYERTNPDDFGADSPYHLTIITSTAETPGGADSVTQAVSQVLPAHIKLHVSVVDGLSWQDLLDTEKTWDDVKTDYEDWNEVEAGS